MFNSLTAVFGMVFHSIYNMWHYKVPLAFALARWQSYTSEYVWLILYILLQLTMMWIVIHYRLPSILWSTLLAWSGYALKYALKTLPSTLYVHSHLHLTVCYQVHQAILLRMFPITLDGLFTACLMVHFQLNSQYILKHTPEYSFQFTPSHTRPHSSGLSDYMLQETYLSCS
jgi:hypothetical protein